MQGSSVTGRSYKTGDKFDVGRLSDFDVAVTNPELLARAKELGLAKANNKYSLPLKAEQMRALGFGDLADTLSERFGRPVNFRIFEDASTVKAKGVSLKIKCS